ncbi:long-chain fatty acid--CoA ligase [Idiomarina loihiensis]|uniref:long-chain fatty acid--CoA ligase n=1 Tax=Idiomarina loihiensis TaxID=135577 RepID=UPI003158498C
MLGNMMKRPLQIIDLLKFAANRHPKQEIVTRQLEGDIHRYGYSDCWQRCGQLAHALKKLGVQPGERVASLAWNTYRHMELYYAVSGSGAVMHTVNPRLFGEQIAWILNHAESGWVFVDLSFVELLESIEDKLPEVKGFVVMTDRNHMPNTKLKNVLCYEELLESEPKDYDWPDVDENSAALLCYTSGTTGNPKGVLASHRAMVLHAQATVSADMLDLRSDTVLMPMVTMYHVAAWGAPYAGPLSGCKLVFTGDGTSGEAMAEMIRTENVTVGLGVPTIWLTLHNYLSENSLDIPSLQRVCVGGAASPMGLVKTYDQEYNVYWQPIWGMTETGPLVHSVPPQADVTHRPKEEQYKLQTTAGRPVFGIEHRIVDAEDTPLPNDGETRGELQVRGHWIASQYFRNDDLSSFPDGWLATGDIAVIDPEGFMKVVDRKKDVIKSGGEWISSLDIENFVSQHKAVNESCVIGVKHPKWDERPLLLVVLNKGESLSKEDIKSFLNGKIARWWMPDDVVFVDELPHTGTGKLVKNTLREQYQNYLQENES